MASTMRSSHFGGLLQAFSTLRIGAPTTRATTSSLRAIPQMQQQQTAQFSATASRLKRKKGVKKDPKITQIRYFLDHPLTPRPLRFSRNRALRHWTIHRAWKLYQTQQRSAYYQQLSAQYHSMNAACEALRLCDADGLTATERDRLGAPPANAVVGEKDSTGRLYRIAMLKKEIWAGVPIEYARIQTESPGKEPWNHAWTR